MSVRAALLRTSVAAALLGPVGCGGDDVADTTTGAEMGGDEQPGETGDPVAPGDMCETALELAAPQPLAASLRHATASPLAEVCAIDGPVVFVRVRLGARADLTLSARGRAYTPTLAVTREGCVSALDDPARLLACGHALPVTLFDLGPDVELLVMIGVAADDGVLALEPGEGDDDPLDFELELELRAVLDEGDYCGPAYGRCEDGTLCSSGDENGVAIDRCRRPPADSCVAPGEQQLPPPGQTLTFTIAADEPHSDAHAHACTGWRRPERVDRLLLPDGLEPGTRLSVRADDPRVGLAVRAADCDPTHALGCAAPGSPAATELNLELPHDAESALLFVELPRPDLGELVGPVEVELELLGP